MINVRKSNERGFADHGWLKSRHTFSFGNYYDEKHMGYRVLRVINEDRILGGTGFGTHPHRDMEIISYVISGELEHKDSMGNSTIIRTDEVQRMSAGTGIQHSEYNHLKDRETHFLQIWILPEKNGIPPSYGQKSFAEDFQKKELVLVVSKEGRDGSISMSQNADVYIGRMKPLSSLKFESKIGRNLWVQMVKGRMKIGDFEVEAGDGVSLVAQFVLDIQNLKEPSEFILFDLP